MITCYYLCVKRITCRQELIHYMYILYYSVIHLCPFLCVYSMYFSCSKKVQYFFNPIIYAVFYMYLFIICILNNCLIIDFVFVICIIIQYYILFSYAHIALM